MKRFISLLIALILFYMMIFPNLNNLLAERQDKTSVGKCTVGFIDIVDF